MTSNWQMFSPNLKKIVLVVDANSPQSLNLLAIMENSAIIEPIDKCALFEEDIFPAYLEHGVFAQLFFIDCCQWESPGWSDFPLIKEGKQYGLTLWQAEEAEAEKC